MEKKGVFKYRLDKSSKKFPCPECGKRTFVKYLKAETNEYLSHYAGRCDRESKCNYHLTPKQYFERSGIAQEENWKPKPKKIEPLKPVKFIAPEIMQRSMGVSNNLITYLTGLFGVDVANDLKNYYRVGTSKKWPGATVFYQIDINEKIHRGKVMLYNPKTGKRDHSKTHSVHAIAGQSESKPPECFFGEHLLKGNNRPVAIVESEKTAMIASIYMPLFVWVACGGLSMLSFDKCKILKGRDVWLFPDLGGFAKWSEKAALYLPSIGCKWTVSEVLEKRATEEERSNGLDLADYLVKFDPVQFLTTLRAKHEKRIIINN